MALGPRVKVQAYRVITVFEVNFYLFVFVFFFLFSIFYFLKYTNMTGVSDRDRCLVSRTRGRSTLGRYQDREISRSVSNL